MSGGVKILDWEEKGNVVRLHLGHQELAEWFGRGWEEYSWSSADSVDEQFVCSHIDIAFPFDVQLVHAADEDSKADMRRGSVPMFTVVSDRRLQMPIEMGRSISILNNLPGHLLMDMAVSGRGRS